ncbi:MAG TPA: hypothetical protein VMR31_11915 [Myxococcota bacterium]|nr:hypothetical protein [Myxococcota bacterium]
MTWVAREATVRRIVDGALRGRSPLLLGGPGMGRSTTANAAAERLRARGIAVAVEELGDDATELGPTHDSVTIRTGGIALHRTLAKPGSAPAPGGGPIQRVPLVPLLRRDLRAWAASEGFALREDEIERAFRASGGQPAVIAAWFEAHRATPSLEKLEERALARCAPLFARIDEALAHPELAKPWEWLAPRGTATVQELRMATGATKASLDRLTLAGPVSRTLGAAAEIAATCALYLRHGAQR